LDAQKSAREAGVNEFVSKNDPPERVKQALSRLQTELIWLAADPSKEILH
jgi:predicted HAD superfamily phosphohydrolase YqeG